MAEIVRTQEIPADNIYKLSTLYSWAMDFYNGEAVKIVSIEDLDNLDDPWIYVNDEELALLRTAGWDWDQQFTVDQFRISYLKPRFFNPKARERMLDKMHLVRIHPQ